MKMAVDMTRSCWLLFTLCLKGILAGDWSVNLPSGPICAVTGSSVVLPCSYDYLQTSSGTKGEGQLSTEAKRLETEGAEGQQYNVLSAMWCLEQSRCITPRYVFHSAGIAPDPAYQNRVQYLGQPGTKNCTLRISDLRESDSGTYVFYLITSHPTQKMPAQSGIQLLVAKSTSAVAALVSPSRDITEGAVLRLGCCSPMTSPDAHFKWYKNTDSNPRYTEQVWNMTAVTSADSGSYYCQIHAGDKEEKSNMVAVDVQYSPRNTAVSILSSGKLGDDLPDTLTCSSDANPPVRTYTWYQGAACLPTADKSFYQGRRSRVDTVRDQTFSSVNITADRDGQHCCVARNKHGSQTSVVSLGGSSAPTTQSGVITVLIGVTITIILLIIIAMVALIMTRKQKSSTHQSYVLTETNNTGP
ncbi:cell adhesion molecule 4-like [Scomber scombrus]|uniref:Cell adhesion molecule 4-like n=1 Tax=Scomber scombrus TaxID=13677 RepID=A0AAV1N690_SCOSC